MNSKTLTIWCNANFEGAARALLEAGTQPHKLIFSERKSASNLVAGGADPALHEADAAFGQPDPLDAAQCERLRWVHLNSAGYTRYDTPEFRAALSARGATLTNSSGVYAEPCAEHAFSFMLAQARQLPQALDEQRGSRAWSSTERRANSRLLLGQSVVLLGFGAIARRLARMLAPFEARITAVRRQAAAVPGVTIVPETRLAEALAEADHVVNILPDNPKTRRLMDAAAFAAMKPGAVFYNIGRGTTVDQDALAAALDFGPAAGHVSRRHRARTAAGRSPALETAELLHHAAYRRRLRYRDGSVGPSFSGKSSPFCLGGGLARSRYLSARLWDCHGLAPRLFMPSMLSPLSLRTVSGGLLLLATLMGASAADTATPAHPNIVFIFSDDHAFQAISAYGDPRKLIETPNIDRIAREGMRFNRCLVPNSICGPSRATVLTGKYNHINGFYNNTNCRFDGSQVTFPKLLQAAGYQTAIVGKWHLETDPTGFNFWQILPGQGVYYNPPMIRNGEKKKFEGYVTDIITDESIAWLKGRDKSKPFVLMCQHKAPHREWEPALARSRSRSRPALR